MSVFTGGPYGRLAVMLNTLSSLNIEIIIIIIIIIIHNRKSIFFSYGYFHVQNQIIINVELENVFMKQNAPNYLFASEQNIHASQTKAKPKSLNNYFCNSVAPLTI